MSVRGWKRITGQTADRDEDVYLILIVCFSDYTTHTHADGHLMLCVSVGFLWRLVSSVNFSLHVSLKLLDVWLSTRSPDPWPPPAPHSLSLEQKCQHTHVCVWTEILFFSILDTSYAFWSCQVSVLCHFEPYIIFLYSYHVQYK